MSIWYLNRARSGGSARAFDSDVLAWRDAVVTNGGSVSLARLIVVDQFVFSEKAAGLWALTDDYWGFWGENSAQALTSLKQLRLATAVNSPVFTPDRGIQGDGSTSYVNLGFDPSLHGVAMTTDSVRLTGYERTNVGGSGATLGVNATTNRAFHIRSGGGNIGANTSGGTTFNLGGDGLGFIAASRRSALASDTFCFKDNISLAKTADATTSGASLPSGAMYAGCLNNAGSPAVFRGTQIGFLSVGASLSDAQETASFTNVQAWATAVGAQV